VELWARNGREILPKVATSTSLLGSFTCRKARHGTESFSSPAKEGVLRIFSPEKSEGFGRESHLIESIKFKISKLFVAFAYILFSNLKFLILNAENQISFKTFILPPSFLPLRFCHPELESS
jgi:hypothetical protein